MTFPIGVGDDHRVPDAQEVLPKPVSALVVVFVSLTYRHRRQQGLWMRLKATSLDLPLSEWRAIGDGCLKITARGRAPERYRAGI